MGFRFRKSFKIAPGVKFSIGKKSMGLSVGGKYGGVSINSKSGVRGRSTIYGTGLSYQWKLGGRSKKSTSSLQHNSPANVTQPLTLNVTTYLVLTIFLGCLGIHRFYRQQIGLGILYFLTAGIFGIGWIIDIVNAIRLYISVKKDITI